MANRVFTAIGDVPPAPTVVTIGAFDGVHRGHQHLLKLAGEGARQHNARLLVLTFEPLPVQVLRPDSFPGRILTNERRHELLFRYGADAVVDLPFTLEVANLSAEEFMERILAVGPIYQIWMGEDFALGRRRHGTATRLAEITAPFGTTVHAIPRVNHEGVEVSSTTIRRLILDGRASDASILLGNRFQITGEVVHGAQVGRTIGFPTANVAPPDDLVTLQDGIYAAFARVVGDDDIHAAMTYIGTRPAVNTGERMIETHLFDFDDDLYGQMLVTEFVRHLRHDADFPNVEALKEQLRRDEQQAREVLALCPPDDVSRRSR